MDLKGDTGEMTIDPSGIVMKNASGTDTIIIDGSNGKLGIGTSNPQRALHIHGNSSHSSSIRISNSLSGTDFMYIQRNNDGDSYILTQGENPLILGANNNYNQLYLKEDGKIGIGTSSFPSVCRLYNYENKSSGWAALSYFGNNTSGVVAGAYNNVAYLGGHNGALNAWTNLAINPDGGNVGIGTTNPSYLLQVEGETRLNGQINFNRWLKSIGSHGPDLYNYHGQLTMHHRTDWGSVLLYYAKNGDPASTYKLQTHSYGIQVHGDAYAVTFHNTSDLRIKTDITDIDDSIALQKVNAIENKEYHYIDPNKKNEMKTLGFIAQQVKEVLPNAVTLQNGYLPDEMRKIENPTWVACDDKWKLQIPDLDLTNDNFTGNVKFNVADDINGNNKNSVDIECEKDDSNNKTPTFIFEKNYPYVFIWGKEVNDFNYLDKNQIFALHHSAIQELSRKNDRLEAENTELKTRMDAMEAAIIALQNN